MTRQALIIHGLNNSPEAMSAIVAELTRAGVTATVARLTGHWEADPADRFRRFKEVRAEVWLEDVERAYHQAVKDSGAGGEGIFLVGFSLGALLGLLLSQAGRAKFSRQVLLAPAIGLHPWSFLPKFAGPWNFPLPSVMPNDLRANSATPLSAYRTLFDLYDRFDPVAPAVPSLVLMSAADELVSFTKVREWVERSTERRLVRLGATKGRGHLILTETHAGAPNWRTMWSAAAEFLNSGPARKAPL